MIEELYVKKTHVPRFSSVGFFIHALFGDVFRLIN